MTRLLVADDETTSLLLLEDVLTDWGFEVVSCADGDEAWEALQSANAPRLAILDWMMPGVDGVELCRRQKARADAAYTYAIVLTSRSEKKDLITALDAGADDYLIKPVDPAELKSRLAVGLRVLAYERVLSEKNQLLQRANEELARLARTDALTGLSNRRWFMECLEAESARAADTEGPLCALMMDLDHFKRINDSHGHAVGDHVLTRFAAVLGAVVRPGGLFGRLGGEEFGGVLPRTSLPEAAEIAERVRARFAAIEHGLGDGSTFRATCSVGVARLGGEAASASTLLARADAALYRAKTAGRNRVCLAGRMPPMSESGLPLTSMNAVPHAATSVSGAASR